jgi:hypothetical protein
MTAVRQERGVIELRSIADHFACTTAWSQRSLSFDRQVTTRDITMKVPSCALARPVSNRPVENRDVWTWPYLLPTKGQEDEVRHAFWKVVLLLSPSNLSVSLFLGLILFSRFKLLLLDISL